MPEYKSPQSEHGTEQRYLLVFLLMAAVIFGGQLLMRKYLPQAPPATARPNPPAGPFPAAAQPAPPPPLPSPASQPRATAAKQATSETETVIENDLYRIVLTNRGAQAKSWVLKKY